MASFQLFCQGLADLGRSWGLLALFFFIIHRVFKYQIAIRDHQLMVSEASFFAAFDKQQLKK